MKNVMPVKNQYLAKKISPFIRWIWAVILGVVLVFVSLVAAYTGILSGGKDHIVMSMSIMSPSFMHGRDIPDRHTCDGLNTSPPLMWVGIPPGTKSLALIVDDPDAPDPAAPQTTWVHWVLYNIPANETGLAEGGTEKNIPAGTLHGVNDWHRSSYGGPCPPIGRHRYFFKLYALDKSLPDLKKPTRAILEKAMQNHVLDQSSMVGYYQRHVGQ
jgi:Raf kinase inhibitor-like YbhB/YbcL family protein